MMLNLDKIAAWLLTGGFRIALAALLAIILLHLVRRAIDRFVKRASSEDVKKRIPISAQRAATLGQILDGVVNTIIWLAVAFVILSEAGIDLRPLLAGAGIVGIAVGLGAKNLVSDVVGGFFLLLEGQLDVGDIVEIEGRAGTVERITLRVVQLRSVDGSLVFIPNGEIKKVINFCREWAQGVADFPVGYSADLEKALAILKEEAEKIYGERQDILLETPEVLGVEAMGNNSLTLRVLLKARPPHQWIAAREFRKNVKNAFDREKIPFPPAPPAL
jgi:small conductance mechanosensitive channel